jgi:hypothetical protein
MLRFIYIAYVVINVAYEINCRHRAPKLCARAVQCYGTSTLTATTTTTTTNTNNSSPQNTPRPFTILSHTSCQCSPQPRLFSPFPQDRCVCAPTRVLYWHRLEHLRVHRTIQQQPVAGRAVRRAVPHSGTDCHVQDRTSHWNGTEWRQRALLLAWLIPIRVWLHLSARLVCHVSDISTLYRCSKLLSERVTVTLFLEAVTLCVERVIEE